MRILNASNRNINILNIKRLCGSGKGSNKQINTCKEVFIEDTRDKDEDFFIGQCFTLMNLGQRQCPLNCPLPLEYFC